MVLPFVPAVDDADVGSAAADASPGLGWLVSLNRGDAQPCRFLVSYW